MYNMKRKELKAEIIKGKGARIKGDVIIDWKIHSFNSDMNPKLSPELQTRILLKSKADNAQIYK